MSTSRKTSRRTIFPITDQEAQKIESMGVSLGLGIFFLLFFIVALTIGLVLPILQFYYLTKTHQNIKKLQDDNSLLDVSSISNNFKKAYIIQVIIFSLFCFQIVFGIMSLFVHRKEYLNLITKAALGKKTE